MVQTSQYKWTLLMGRMYMHNIYIKGEWIAFASLKQSNKEN